MRQSTALARAGGADGESSRETLGEKLGIEHDPAIPKIGDTGAERDQRSPSGWILDLEKVTCSIILDCHDQAHRISIAIKCRKPNEVGVIIFILAKGRQRRSVDFNERATKGFRLRSVANAFELGDDRAAAIANGKEAPSGASDIKHSISFKAARAVGEKLQPHFAPDAVRSGNRGERDPGLAAAAHGQP